MTEVKAQSYAYDASRWRCTDVMIDYWKGQTNTVKCFFEGQKSKAVRKNHEKTWIFFAASDSLRVMKQLMRCDAKQLTGTLLLASQQSLKLWRWEKGNKRMNANIVSDLFCCGSGTVFFFFMVSNQKSFLIFTNWFNRPVNYSENLVNKNKSMFHCIFHTLVSIMLNSNKLVNFV